MSQENSNVNDERKARLQKLEDLRELGINPYPARVSRTHTAKQALEEAEGSTVTITGRLMLKRDMGKLAFCQLRDASGQVQIALKQDDIGKESYKVFVKKLDVGDILQITGERFVTHKGEQSVMIASWVLLSKALLPLPDKFHGMNDEELRYRKRYIDFLVNPEEKEKIEVRSRLVRAMRDFLHGEGFMEVETPMLETIASGAMAKTFDTHLNAFDLDVHLRICIGELWQKRLLVGGFEKTFEIGRAFRNEGVDRQHNPEFTMIEFYWAYADYEDNMALHERMLPYIVKEAVGSLVVEHDGHKIDFSGPYPRVTFHDVVLEHSGIDINDYADKQSLGAIMKEKGYDVDPSASRGKLVDNLYKQTARPSIIQPTFVLNYPAELKPLAKKAEDPRYTEMFQLIVNGFELSNSYTELNDPIDQRERFEEQAQDRADGDDEAMQYDHDYVEALEHAMPPATGTGIGIDRFAALITGSHTLREVTTFPLVKPKE
jgi:lysyl-tRNA synthetase, class II